MEFFSSEPDRFLWHRLGQDDPQDVVVFDRLSGLTHRIIAVAQDVHERMAADQTGWTLAELAQWWTGRTEPEAEALQHMDELLQVMVKAQLVRVRPMNQLRVD